MADAGPLRAALSLTPSYLRDTANELDFRDWQVPLGRRLRSLKLWFVLRAYGRAGLQGFVRHAAALAARFECHVSADPRFVLTSPRRLGLVCFALAGPATPGAGSSPSASASSAATAALVEAVNRGGRAMLVCADVGGRTVARAAIGGVHTQAAHVDAAWSAVVDALEGITVKGKKGGGGGV